MQDIVSGTVGETNAKGLEWPRLQKFSDMPSGNHA
jgi:hypothetical protein